MITPAKERMRKSRARRRLGLRPVQVLVSERQIDFLLARHYERFGAGAGVPLKPSPMSDDSGFVG